VSDPARVEELLGRVLAAEAVDRFPARDGLEALPLAAPRTEAEAVEVLGLARSERWVVLPVGAGTKLGWARPPRRVDLVLSARNLSGVVAYEPDDGTITARAGTPWSELVARTAARHHLSPELPAAAPATLGGVLGSGASGLDRLRHGPLRHQVLGITALHADGARVRSGGRVVKNVTGYDLHRLWCGSQGTLCFLLEATLRLYPAPTACALLRARVADLETGVAHAHALWRAGVQPLAVVLTGGPVVELAVVLAGRPEALASEVATTRPHLPGAEVLEGPDAYDARAALREGALEEGRWPVLALSCRPSRLPPLLARLQATLGAAAPRITVHPLLATVAVGLDPSAARAARTALEDLAGDGVQLHWRGLGASMPPARIAAGALALMRRVKSSLDPQGVFPAGRFHEEL